MTTRLTEKARKARTKRRRKKQGKRRASTIVKRLKRGRGDMHTNYQIAGMVMHANRKTRKRVLRLLKDQEGK